MTEDWNIKNLITTIYLVPFVFLGLYGDFYLGSMCLYGIALFALSLLFRYYRRRGKYGTILIGNGVSFLSSCLFTVYLIPKMASHYFKPFTPLSLVCAISLIVFSIQLALFKRTENEGNLKRLRIIYKNLTNM